ncbi:MAG: alpha/beta hydrolase [Desulfobulbaceae bacterium]|nr:alpha/beta hydrolase [Desulfobulbaceae bacterium]
MQTIFSHGQESGPWGSKIKRLADVAVEYGLGVESVDYRGIIDPDLRVARLLAVIKEVKDEVILVGSSMGGYVSLVASSHVDAKGIFLLAPALYMDGYEKQTYRTSHRHLEIVHGWSDEVVPCQNSIRFAQGANVALHLIPGDHRLNSSIEMVEGLFRSFLTEVVDQQHADKC